MNGAPSALHYTRAKLSDSDYLERLTRFREAARGFGASLSDVFATRILEFSRKHENPTINLLDVGSSAGSLLTDVLAKSANQLKLGSVLALEPDGQSFIALQANKSLAKWKVDTEQITIEELTSQSNRGPCRFNVVLLSHVFYHFIQPIAILEALRTVTAEPCLLLIALDSHDGELYRFVDRFRHFDNLACTDQYGSYLSADKLRTLLDGVQYPFEETMLKSVIQIDSCTTLIDAVEFLGRRLLGPNSNTHKVYSEAARCGLRVPGRHELAQTVFIVER